MVELQFGIKSVSTVQAAGSGVVIWGWFLGTFLPLLNH